METSSSDEESWNEIGDSLLPSKSRHLYEDTYNAYRKWRFIKKIKTTCEDSILKYFNSDLSRYKSLGSKYCMLRATINLHEGIDISEFPGVVPFLKRKLEGYKPKKSPKLTKDHVDEFLLKADNREHLFNKVVLIFGLAGACRRQELVTLLTTSVQDCKTHFLVTIKDTNTNADRSFIIVPGRVKNINLLEHIRRYMALRPATTAHNRFFVNYVNEKCTVRAVGIHKIGNVPAVVAKYLKLEDSSSYTAHCFRRT